MKRIALVLVFALAPLPALAGTTGWMTGTVRDLRDGALLANVTIALSSPSQIAQTKTDAHGRYCFMSLAPDRYYANIERDGYTPANFGVAIHADAPRHLSLWMTSDLSQYVRHSWYVMAGSLVQEGTSGDVYGYDNRDFLVAPPLQSDYWMLRMLPGVMGSPSQAGTF